jgi:NAD(P)-dependent dehydrogenase (short-subunit alcohol dehydrogenase family)
MRFHNRTVIVTGGIGALGTAVVGALLADGARCLVPYRPDADVDTFPYKDRVTLVSRCDLTDEADVSRLYGGVTDLWASIHLAGGFAMGDMSATDKPV